MKVDFELIAEARTESGKGASRRLRHAGKIPAILYGGGGSPQSLTLSHNSVARHLEHEAFYSHILSITIDGREEKAVLRDLQRHPSKPRILHLDLQRVSATEKLRMRVPLHFIGEEIAPGVKQSGGIVSHLLNDVEVLCLPQDLPAFIDADLTDVKLNEALHLSHLKLPAGVELVALSHGLTEDRIVASIHLPRTVTEDSAAPDEGVAPPVEDDTKS